MALMIGGQELVVIILGSSPSFNAVDNSDQFPRWAMDKPSGNALWERQIQAVASVIGL